MRIATGKSGLITVKYTVQTERPFVSVPFIDPKRAFIRPTRIFMFPKGIRTRRSWWRSATTPDGHIAQPALIPSVLGVSGQMTMICCTVPPSWWAHCANCRASRSVAHSTGSMATRWRSLTQSPLSVTWKGSLGPPAISLGRSPTTVKLSSASAWEIGEAKS